jgi:hypothetical protein
MRSLRTLMALALVLAIAAPAAAGAGAWLAGGAWQAQRQHVRRDAAARVVKDASLDQAGVVDRLSAMGIEADLAPNPKVASDALLTKMKMSKLAEERTPGLEAILAKPDGKQELSKRYESVGVELPEMSGQLFIPRQSSAPRWAFTVAAAALALAAALWLPALLLAATLAARLGIRPRTRT